MADGGRAGDPRRIMGLGRNVGGTGTTIRIAATGAELHADVTIPHPARGVVLFAHGSGGSRRGPRDRAVADLLNLHGHGTVLVDLLTPEENHLNLVTTRFRFHLGVLAGRLIEVVDWAGRDVRTAGLPIALFGSRTGAAVALLAAAALPRTVKAVVSRGGRPDLARPVLSRLRTPTLLLVGDRDRMVARLNHSAALAMRGVTHHLELIRGAGHMFDEPDALEAVARLSAAWYDRYLTGDRPWSVSPAVG